MKKNVLYALYRHKIRFRLSREIRKMIKKSNKRGGYITLGQLKTLEEQKKERNLKMKRR